MIFVGIDPGQKGGIAILSNSMNKGVLMPLYGKEIAAAALLEYINEVQGDRFVCVEKVHAMPKQGVSSTFKFGMGYGKILGVLECAGISHQLVTPQAWKKVVLAGTNRDKNAAIEFCQRMYPMIDLQPGKCRTPQDGIADAVCIAHYAKLMDKGT